MELGSQNSLAGTYDNVEAILKRILIFISETFDTISKVRVLLNTSSSTGSSLDPILEQKGPL